MRFLVTGVKGQLGYDVVKELKKRGYDDIIECDIDEMDITDKYAVDNVIVLLKPDVVIHCSAYTAVDKAEDNENIARNVNANGTRNIAGACKRANSKLIYISTDYVFDGEKPYGETYDVNDPVNPLSVYGKTKYEGERFALENPKTFVVRTSWVFGINGNNFIKTMRKLAETKIEVNVVSDQYGSPTYTVDLAKLLVDMSLTDKYGIYHANNEGYTNWSTFASKIFEKSNIDMGVNPITTDMYPTKAVRPKNSCLSKECLDRNGFNRLPSWEDALDRYIVELENTKEDNKTLKLKK